MNLKIHFGKLERLDWVENKILDESRQLDLKGGDGRDIVTNIWIDRERPRKNSSPPYYQVSASIVRPKMKEIFVKSKNHSLRKGLLHMFKVLKVKLYDR